MFNLTKSIFAFFVAFSFIIPSSSFALGDNSTDTSSGSGCLRLQNNMSYRTRDSRVDGEVSELQAFLQEQGLLNSEPTGYFGALTFRAVKDFQGLILTNVQASDIDTTLIPSTTDRETLAIKGFLLNASGYVGAYTRAKIAYMSCQGEGDTNDGIAEDGVPTALTIKTTALPNAIVGAAYTGVMRSIGGTGTRDWVITGTLPAGLELNRVMFTQGLNGGTGSQPATIGFMGIPTTAGTYSFTATVITGTQRDSNLFTIVVVPPSSSNVDGKNKLTVNLVGTGTGGWVKYSPLGEGFPSTNMYASGTPVVLTATTSPGHSSTFTGWSGACTGTATTCTVTMSAAKSVTATFSSSSNSALAITSTETLPTATAGVPYTVTLTSTGGTGSIAWSLPYGANSIPGGLALNGSTGVISGTPTMASVGNTFFNVKLTRGSEITFGNFTMLVNTGGTNSSYNLNVSNTGTGTGIITALTESISCGRGSTACSSLIQTGKQVTLTAEQNPGSTFTGWSGACTGTATTCTVTMSAAKTVTATFTSSSQSNTCTSWTYSTYGACQSNSTQARTITSSSPSGCTGGTPAPLTTSCTYTPPAQPTCTGTHPARGNGVVLNYWTNVAAGGGGVISSNTVWQYGAGSCGWSCTAPMIQDGNNGCKNPTPGSGVTVTVTKSSGSSGVVVNPAIAGMNVGQEVGTFTTDIMGRIPEFWFPSTSGGGWTSIGIVSNGYKIRTAKGCTPDVRIHAGKQVNYCTGARNNSFVSIELVPGDISTMPVTSFTKSYYMVGDYLVGAITGGDPNNTWACMDSPNTLSGQGCLSGMTNMFRKLGGTGDAWQTVSDSQGDSIKLSPVLISGYPEGTYTAYARTGQWGTISPPTNFTVNRYR